MKFAARAILVVCLAVLGCHALQWENIKTVMESPHNRKIIEQFYPKDAGSGNQTRTGRITNGAQAKLSQFPHQVYLITHEVMGGQ